MRVSVPGADSPRRLFSFGRDLNALDPSDYYEFDFQHVQFVTPGWLVAVGTALRRFRAGKTKRRAINYRHLGYAAHVGFFKYFGMSYGLAPSEAAGSINYVPMTEVVVASIRERAATTYVHAGEIVEDEARQLAKLLTRNEGVPAVDTLTYSLREIVRNVIEHSKSPTYTISAQYWPSTQLAELAFSDDGCGIASSLRENPNLRIETDLTALKLAVLPGISSKAWRRANRSDVWANSGYGLFMTQRLCALGGQVTLLSGNNGIVVIDDEMQELETYVPGTIVVLRLNAGAISDLSRRLAEFRAEGHALAKKVGTADHFGPSLASRLLRPQNH
jgi:hypothetical protein